MCGIAGCYGRADGRRLTALMSERIAHRGPDSEGLYSFENGSAPIHLAHRRLAIIDLSPAGFQPFVKDGLALSYNGEIYNYKQVRAELEALGCSFRSATDTEVLLEAWRCWGPRALARLRGMFAFAIFDERSGHLVLARDHLGIKPLYFHCDGDGMVFASELKAVVRAIGSDLKVDPAALVASLLYYWVPDHRCALMGVQKLAPGSWAEFRPDGRVAIATYWCLRDVAAEAASGPPADLGEIVQDSVRAHLVADVPVSTFLSGGLDSSIITVLAKRANPAIDAYTISFRPEDQRLEAMPDDARYARMLAAKFGITLHEIEIAPRIASLLPQIVDILDEPIGDPAAINTLLICQAARAAGVKVLLSGMGADELFGGYRKHYACLLAARYRRLPAGLRAGIRPVVDHLPLSAGGRGIRQTRWAKRFLSFAEMAEEPAFRRSYTLYAADQLTDLLDPSLAPLVESALQEHADVYNDTTLEDHVNRMCLADARLFLPGLNLAYTDRASMAASTEVRVPFVDVEVVRAAFSLPGSTKIVGHRGKVPLKSAAEPWVPREIIDRPKGLFSAPLRAWVARDLGDLVREVVLGGDLVGSGFLNRSAVERLLLEESSGREDRSKNIWQLLSMQLWHQQTCALGVGSALA